MACFPSFISLEIFLLYSSFVFCELKSQLHISIYGNVLDLWLLAWNVGLRVEFNPVCENELS